MTAFWLSLAVTDRGLELTTSSLRQNISWACFSLSATCSLPCINPHSSICTVSRWAEINESPSGPVFGQDEISLHGSKEATYSLQLARMEWELKVRKLRPLVSWSTFSDLLWWPSHWQGQASSGQNALLNENCHQNIYCCLFHNVHLIIVNDAQTCAVIKIRNLHTCKFEGRSEAEISIISFSVITLRSCFEQANKLVYLNLPTRSDGSS